MFRLSLLLIALAGFGAIVAQSSHDPRASTPADARAARAYAGVSAPGPIVAHRDRAPNGEAAASGEAPNATPSDAGTDTADDLLTITTAEGEVIRVATQIPPASIDRQLVRIAAEDENAEARRLEAANARARAAVAERAATTADPPPPTAENANVVYATGAYINLRSGPSTAYPVVGFMNYGMAAERLEAPQDGWSRIRVLETGAEGFMFSAYLSDRAP